VLKRKRKTAESVLRSFFTNCRIPAQGRNVGAKETSKRITPVEAGESCETCPKRRDEGRRETWSNFGIPKLELGE